MDTKKTLKISISLFLAGFFIWLVFRQINISELQKTFSKTDIFWVIAGVFSFLVGYACRIERWKQMLKCDNSKLTWLCCAGPLFGSFAANNVLFFRAGDVLRTFAFNSKLGVTSGVVIATLFAERLLDLLLVLFLFGIALNILGVDVLLFTGIGSTVLIVMSIIIMAVLIFPRFFTPLVLSVSKFTAKKIPRIGDKLFDEINKSLLTLQNLAHGSRMPKLIIWSLAVWLAEGCVYWFAALAITPIDKPIAAWLAVSLGTLSTIIPSTPGYVGTFEYFTVRAMTELGNDLIAATAYALLVHAILWLPTTIIGGLYLLLHPRKKIELRPS